MTESEKRGNGERREGREGEAEAEREGGRNMSRGTWRSLSSRRKSHSKDQRPALPHSVPPPTQAGGREGLSGVGGGAG